jgi:hypothetical protein
MEYNLAIKRKRLLKYYCMDEPQKHCFMRNKSNKRDSIVGDSFSTKCPEKVKSTEIKTRSVFA